MKYLRNEKSKNCKGTLLFYYEIFEIYKKVEIVKEQLLFYYKIFEKCKKVKNC